MRLKRVIAAIVLSLGFASLALAQSPTPLSVVAVRHYGEGVGRVFEFDVANAADRAVTTRGRLVVINVYDASPPTTISVRDFTIQAGGTATTVVRWDDAPLLGQIRTLLVLNDGQHASLVESYNFWILPLYQAAAFIGVSALLAAGVLLAMRLPKYLRARVPSGMLPYVVEFDDTVVSLAARFDVTWQDVVRANRLRPPYELKPGERVFIPKHDLHRPDPAPKA